jgi:hypothetical protein
VEAKIESPLVATIVVVWFVGTVIAMSMREYIGAQLGFIAMSGAISLVLVVIVAGRFLAASADSIAEITGIGASFMARGVHGSGVPRVHPGAAVGAMAGGQQREGRRPGLPPATFRVRFQ